jgi:hypothetical protein
LEESVPDSNNPYQIPQAAIEPVKPLAAGGLLTEIMLKHLKAASPWLRFIGILSYIGCGFMALGGLVVMIIDLLLSERFNAISPAFDNFGQGMGAALGAVYLVFGLVLFIPVRFLYRFGSKIRSYFISHAEQELEEALKNNKSFWKFCGICAIIQLAIIPVGIAAGIITALVSSFTR